MDGRVLFFSIIGICIILKSFNKNEKTPKSNKKITYVYKFDIPPIPEDTDRICDIGTMNEKFNIKKIRAIRNYKIHKNRVRRRKQNICV